ncbi:MAG TPA: ornithine cyclodeaminase family protein [Candidatus Acidoferrales bacterium]|nr:ornithine cyclodeaminase family protein [Candidatus Acidoferrales bacterium]
MPLLLTETDVRSLLTMSIALEAVETAFRRLADATAQVHPRRRLHLEGFSYLHYMAAADGAGGYEGLKIYTSSRDGLRFLIPLFRAKTGELLAFIEADFLGQMRTGAASGVATKYLAHEDSRTVGIIGTGLQARTQLEAVTTVRGAERILVFGRDPGRRERFAGEMTAKLGVRVEAAATAEAVVREAGILITSTTSSTPVVEGRWLQPGAHINAIGANFPQKRELDASAIDRANVIFVDSREQAEMEAGDLIQSFAGTPSHWETVKELSDLVAGRTTGRASREQITLFKSSGIAIEDVVTAGKVYELALKRGVGREVPFWRDEGARERTAS